MYHSSITALHNCGSVSTDEKAEKLYGYGNEKVSRLIHQCLLPMKMS